MAGDPIPKLGPKPKKAKKRKPPVFGPTGEKLTDRNRTVQGVKKEATTLCALIVRTTRGPMCENQCGRPVKDHAHIVGRSYAHTRTDETNGLALCGTCHQRFDNFHDDRDALLTKLGLVEHYEFLKRKALDGVNVKFDWYSELDRLKAIWAQVERMAA